MIVSNKEILYINSLIENAVDMFHNFWPMTSFIHHNPLHGFENMHFEEAICKAQTYFHNRKFLPRKQYQKFYNDGKIDSYEIKKEIKHYCDKKGLDSAYERLFFHIFTDVKSSCLSKNLQETKEIASIKKSLSSVCVPRKVQKLGSNFGFCDAIDSLYGTNLCQDINDKLNKMAMRHLDEGQAVWLPADKDKGMFASWKRLIRKDSLFFDKSVQICRILTQSDKPEDVIFWILSKLKIPKDGWEEFFVLQFGKLHGWTGFLRWRSTNSDYLYQKKYPAYLEEFLAIRLYFLYMYLLKTEKSLGFFPDFLRLKQELDKKESFLRVEYNTERILPQFIYRYEKAIQNNTLDDMYDEYMIAFNEEFKLKSAKKIHSVLKNSDLEFDDYVELLHNIEEFEDKEGFVWLKAMEETYLKSLMRDMLPNIQNRALINPLAQLFFCIDVRSESIRRKIEESGNFETFGIAGFFGIPLKLIDIVKQYESNLCPAVVKPKNVVYRFEEGRSKQSLKLKKALKHIYHDLKYNTMSSYITVETIGLLFGFDFFGKTIFANFYIPKRKKLFSQDYKAGLLVDKYTKEEILSKIKSLQKEILKIAIKENFTLDATALDGELEEFLEIVTSHENTLQKHKSKIEPVTSLAIALNLMHYEELKLQELLENEYQISYFHKLKHIELLSKVGFTFKEQLFYAKNALKLTGLSKDFAPFVVFCGHESTSQNNPYESALDCGACGGKSSDTNARVLSYILNKPEIREALKSSIDIPSETIFVSALHNTVTDKVVLDFDFVPKNRQQELLEIQKRLDIASENSALERAKSLPFADSLDRKTALKFMQKNAHDWSQTRPEWGLATNHSFIIAPRDVSKGIEFRNRVFLHSYDYRQDRLGYYLEIILSSPLVVGEWINMEHFFSSLDNRAFGSESKVYHNVVGRFGVISGNMSDLRTGLAAQSVHRRGEIHHEPIRLLTFIDAPFKKYRVSIDKIKKVSELVYNEWVKMVFMDREEEAFFYYSGNLQKWKKIEFKDMR